MVANCHFKTPTALADFIVDWTAGVEEQVMDLLASIQDAVGGRLVAEERSLGRIFAGIRYSLSDRTNALESVLKKTFASLTGQMALKVMDAETMADRLLTGIAHASALAADRSDRTVREYLVRITTGATTAVASSESEVNRCLTNILFALNATVSALEGQVALADASIRASDPRNILRQGYVLAMDKDGTVLKNVSSRSVGDSFALKFIDGMWDCLVNGIKADAPGKDAGGPEGDGVYVRDSRSIGS